jgi:prephenate dehydrogenase
VRIAMLGLGLIGGSIARALRTAAETDEPSAGDASTVAAWTPRGDGPRDALAAGVIEAAAATPGEAIEGADLVVLAAPPAACLRLLADLAGPLRGALASDAVITDVASTKSVVVDQARRLDLRFVGGHPMAGRETTGFGAADGSLFRDRPWIVVPFGDDAAVARVEWLATSCGARPIRMAAAEHDGAVAAISHLPLILSAALVEAVAGHADAPRADWPELASLAAGGWASMTRLARGDIEMGTGIAVTNAPAIARRLRDLREVLDAWLTLLETPDGPDAAGVRDRLASARTMLER